MKEKYVISLFLTLLVLDCVYAAEDKSMLVISNEAWTNINKTITIYGTFFNNENKTVNASFIGDLYFGAEKVSSFNTGSVEVRAGEHTTFAIKVIPQNLGRYNIKAFVAYSEELTSTSDGHFNTMANSTMVPFATSYAIFALIGVVVTIALVKVMMNRGGGELTCGYNRIKVYEKEKYKL